MTVLDLQASRVEYNTPVYSVNVRRICFDFPVYRLFHRTSHALDAQLRQKTGGRSSTTSTTPQSPGDADLLFAARERVSAAEGASLSAWMLRQGAGDLLLYLAARSVRLGVIASPRTTPAEFESFVEQLRRQSTRVQAAITPMAIKLDGLDAVLTKAMGELDVGGRGSAVLVVGSSEPILSAATAAEMFTARYHPPNGVREGVIQTFTVRDIDGVSVGKHGGFDTLSFLEGPLAFVGFLTGLLYSTQLFIAALENVF